MYKYRSSQFMFKLASVSFLYGFFRDVKRHSIIPVPRFRNYSKGDNVHARKLEFSIIVSCSHVQVLTL